MPRPNDFFDVLVVGLGGVGSAAVHYLATEGLTVAGVDQFTPPHHHGSSHGRTRVIRQAYFEHPSYVPLLMRAYRLWHELQSSSGRAIFERTGLIEIGPPDGVVIPGVLRSARQYDLNVERMTMSEAKTRLPGLDAPDDWVALVEQDAGYLRVERCIETYLDAAAANGARLFFQQRVNHWQVDGTGVRVHGGNETYRARKLVLCGGPWSEAWLRSYGVPLTVLRKHIYHYAVRSKAYDQAGGFPSYFFETPHGFFYGTPVTDELGLKVARHSGGQPAARLVDDAHRRDADDQRMCETFFHNHLPDVSDHQTHWRPCYYTMTPDDHFVLDRLPDHRQVTVVAGLSGHGFKFASVLGKIAAELTTEQTVPEDIRFLRADRFGGSRHQASIT